MNLVTSCKPYLQMLLFHMVQKKAVEIMIGVVFTGEWAAE